MDKTIEQIKPETIALIASQAEIANMTVDEYLRSLIPRVIGSVSREPSVDTNEQRIQRFLAWANRHHSDAAALSLEDISRETIY